MKDNGFDRYLQNLAHISQIILVIGALFGYFYTVRPIHQKDLLDEQNAQKQIELGRKERELRELEKQKTVTAQENSELRSEKGDLSVTVSNLRQEKNGLSARLLMMRQENKKASQVIRDNRSLVLWRLSEFAYSRSFPASTLMAKDIFCNNCTKTGLTPELIKKAESITLHNILEYCIGTFDYSHLTNEDKKAFLAFSYSYIKSHSKELDLNYHFDAILSQYVAEVSSDFTGKRVEVYKRLVREKEENQSDIMMKALYEIERNFLNLREDQIKALSVADVSREYAMSVGVVQGIYEPDKTSTSFMYRIKN